ncbi:MAG: Cache 3/Cache 2 fusion domain-containing protein [Bacteroidales bacterium]|nr:Cache 3/Cache 2 fusion domain-containing protein [Bacteroidales bacterium]
MSFLWNRIPVKTRFYVTIVTGIILMAMVITLITVGMTRRNMYRSLERNLTTEVQTIVRMFERERALKLDKVYRDLKVAHELFYRDSLEISPEESVIPVTNQVTHAIHQAKLQKWSLDGQELFQNDAFIDRVHLLTDATVTLFQKIDSGFVRIATNVLQSDGTRAVGTYIPLDSSVADTIRNQRIYFGRSFVVHDWYITAYEPIIAHGEVIGMLYVGDKEKDLDKLRDILLSLKIGKSGFPFVMDEQGNYIIHPSLQGEKCSNKEWFDRITRLKEGLIVDRDNPDRSKYMTAFDYYEDFKFYVGASLPVKEETAQVLNKIILNSLILSFTIIIAFSIFVYYLTIENVKKFLAKLDTSQAQLDSTRSALAQSEQHFKTLFNNSSDDIFVIDMEGNFLEVNQVACDNLGYCPAEFKEMNFRDIKTPKYLDKVERNLETIRMLGRYRYESENVAKNGKVIPVEMKSRIIEYRGEKAILTIARDISERKEIEEKILRAIVQTEERERKRFAADLHDGLAPILSTIKLYTDILKKANFKKISNEEAIGNVEELVDMAIKSTREISNNIRPSLLQDFGLAAAIHEFTSYIRATNAVEIEVNTQQYTIDHRGLEETILYQSVQELINNTLKHSRADHIKIDLKSFDNQIILYYRDNGIGFDLNAELKRNAGYGLNNIINKMKTIKGSCDINSEPGKGMFLIASVRIPDNNR